MPFTHRWPFILLSLAVVAAMIYADHLGPDSRLARDFLGISGFFIFGSAMYSLGFERGRKERTGTGKPNAERSTSD